jgi:heme oxygenase
MSDLPNVLPDGARPVAIDALRAATREAHDRIESLVDLSRMGDLVRYRRTLGAFATFLRAWEPAMLAVLPPSHAAWFAERSRLPMLEQDLKVLGGPMRSGPLRLPALADACAAWGSMYVLEGSALGGRVIARHMMAQHGLTPAQGCAYFHGWGDRSGARWAEFRAVLEERLADASMRQRACDAACDTFEALAFTCAGALDDELAVA